MNRLVSVILALILVIGGIFYVRHMTECLDDVSIIRFPSKETRSDAIKSCYNPRIIFN